MAYRGGERLLGALLGAMVLLGCGHTDSAEETDDEEERTAEGFIRCDAENFVPRETTFETVIGDGGEESGLSFFLYGGSPDDTRAWLYVYGSRTECLEGVHQLAFYGEYLTPLRASQNEDGDVLYFFNDGQSDIQVTTIAEGTPCTAPSVEACLLVTSVDQNTIVLEVLQGDEPLSSTSYPLQSPVYIPLVG